MAVFPILTSDGDTIVTSDGFAAVVQASAPVFTAGSILIPGADVDEVATILSAETGAILGTMPALPTAECGDILPSGIWAIAAQTVPAGNVTAINLYDAQSVLIQTIPAFTPPAHSYEFSPVRGNRSDAFYFLSISTAGGSTTPRVHRIADDGTVGGTVWSLTATTHGGPSAMAPSLDDTILYYGIATASVVNSTAVARWDLVNDVALTDLVPPSAGRLIGRDLLVLASGEIIVPVLPSALSPWELRRYSAAGSVLATYVMDADAATGDEIELGTNPLGTATFWARTYPSATTSRFLEITISDGSYATDFTVTTVDGDGNHVIPISCPFLVRPDTFLNTTSYPIRRLRRWAP